MRSATSQYVKPVRRNTQGRRERSYHHTKLFLDLYRNKENKHFLSKIRCHVLFPCYNIPHKPIGKEISPIEIKNTGRRPTYTCMLQAARACGAERQDRGTGHGQRTEKLSGRQESLSGTGSPAGSAGIRHPGFAKRLRLRLSSASRRRLIGEAPQGGKNQTGKQKGTEIKSREKKQYLLWKKGYMALVYTGTKRDGTATEQIHQIQESVQEPGLDEERNEIRRKEIKLVDYLLRDAGQNTSRVVKADTKGARRAELLYEVVEKRTGRRLSGYVFHRTSPSDTCSVCQRWAAAFGRCQVWDGRKQGVFRRKMGMEIYVSVPFL